MADKQKALVWLNKQLKKKCIALNMAERKPNRVEREITDIKSVIDILEYIIKVVQSAGEGE